MVAKIAPSTRRLHELDGQATSNSGILVTLANQRSFDKAPELAALRPPLVRSARVGQLCGGCICQCLARLHPEGLFYLIGGKYRSDAMAGTSWLHSSPTTSLYSGTMRQVR
jgi:hypothetical protein